METDDGQREKERTGEERPRETRALWDGAKVTGKGDEPVCLRGARRPVSRLLRPLLRSAGFTVPCPRGSGSPSSTHSRGVCERGFALRSASPGLS